jgi:hypothetical protein
VIKLVKVEDVDTVEPKKEKEKKKAKSMATDNK